MTVAMAEGNQSLVDRLGHRMAELSSRLENSSIAEYVALYRRPWRLFYFQFMSGIFRGFGIAVGFTAIGALFLYVLGKVAALNLPVIGHFVAEIARIVEMELSIPP